MHDSLIRMSRQELQNQNKKQNKNAMS
jgi:hypothetical protein